MDAANCGILSLVPAFGFLIFALATRKCICAVILSALSGYIIYYKGDFLQPAIDAFMKSTTDWDNNYIIVICLLFGCLVQLLRESKGALAIGEAAKKYVKSDTIKEALENARAEIIDEQAEFTGRDMIYYDLVGSDNASNRRSRLGDILGIGYCSAKQFLKRVNNYKITREELEEAMEKYLHDEESGV